MTAPLSLAFLIYASILWAPSSTYYRDQQPWKSLRQKLNWLSRELFIDAEMKIKSVQQYRGQYYKTLQYQLGNTMYEMRNYFNEMVRAYQDVDRNFSYGRHDQYKSIKKLVLVHQMSMEIENKVTMIRTWQIKRETKKQHAERMQSALRSGTNHVYDELEDVPLREVLVRERMARGAAAGAPPLGVRTRPPEFNLGGQRKKKMWRHVRDADFARRSI